MTKIETSRLTLRPLIASDAETVARISHQSSGVRYMVFDDEADVLAWIQSIDSNHDKPSMAFAIIRKSDGKIIGAIGVGPAEELNGEIELVYFIGEEYQGNGYATEAGKAIIWWLFEKVGLDVLSSTVSQENAVSRRVLDKLGFVCGGTRTLPRKDGIRMYDYFRLYHTDWLPGPEWDAQTLYKAEPMDAFFNLRADTYNAKMLSDGGGEDYKKLGGCFPETDAELYILDIGCGTGIELESIWKRVPNARITCVDVSRGMLDLLLKNHPGRHRQITVVEASYVTWAYPDSAFDIVVSNMTMHHFGEREKIAIYRKILGSLKPGGFYIEGDFMVDAIAARQYKRRYEIITANLPEEAQPGQYHIDIPFTIEVQKNLLKEAGFNTVEVLRDDINHGSGAILKAGK
ncbi:MAG: GNAT family N-acetyltransferase [Oscillospiraceae bacterium]|nr:GNAT family N-acetyltransferase [Oscillospiraceae bacterium]